MLEGDRIGTNKKINLTPKPDKPKKEKVKTKRTKKIQTPNYQYELNEICIYIGGLSDEEHKNTQCKVISRSKQRKIKEYYKIQFEDDVIVSTIDTALKKLEKVEEESID